jgi:choline kinase
MEIFTGVILAAGQGRRLRKNGQICSKPMTVIADKPLITYSIDAMIHSGVKKIIVVYQQASKDVLTLNGYENILTFVEDTDPQGKLKTLIRAKDYVNSLPLIVSYGDIVVDKEDFSEMLEKGLAYEKQGADLVIQTVDNPSIVPSDDEPWDKSILIEDGKIVEWVRGGAKFNPEYPNRLIKQGGMIYLWFKNPFDDAESYIEDGHSSYAGFMHYYVKEHGIYPMNIADIWDIDKAENIEQSNKILTGKRR